MASLLSGFRLGLSLSRIKFHTGFILRVKGIPIKMPALSPTMTEGTIVKWLKKEGDVFKPGDVLCDIQTDKAVMAMEMEEEGRLAKIIMGDDSKDVQIGTVIGLMVNEDEDWKTVEMPTDIEPPKPVTQGEVKTAVSSPQPPTPTPPPPPPPTVAGSVSSKMKTMGPAVKSLLSKFGLAADKVPATGPKGILLKSDVLKHVSDAKIAPVQVSYSPPPAAKAATPTSPTAPATKSTPGTKPPARYIDIPVTAMRRTIAKRLLESKMTIPHAYLSVDCVLDGIVGLRKDMKESGRKGSVNDFIIKACALALQRVPAVNVHWTNEAVQVRPEVDISVAVATEAGLITPIVKNAPFLRVEEISETVKKLAEKARAGKLQPHEFTGGTFTISNLGMFGVTHFSAIINPPQAAILAVGSTRRTLNEELMLRKKMMATLSYDARAIEEDSAAMFLQVFRDLIENPNLLTVPGERIGLPA